MKKEQCVLAQTLAARPASRPTSSWGYNDESWETWKEEVRPSWERVSVSSCERVVARGPKTMEKGNAHNFRSGEQIINVCADKIGVWLCGGSFDGAVFRLQAWRKAAPHCHLNGLGDNALSLRAHSLITGTETGGRDTTTANKETPRPSK